MLKRHQIKKNTIVKFIAGYEPTSLAKTYLSQEDVIYVAEHHVYNDAWGGDYIFLRSGSGLNSSDAYLKDLELNEAENLPFYKVVLKSTKEAIFSSLFISDAHHFINVNRSLYYDRNDSLELERWQVIDGVETKLQLQKEWVENVNL